MIFGKQDSDNTPLDESWFYPDGSIKVERYTLDFGEGLPQMEIRKIYGEWEYLAYRKASNGYERWSKLERTEEYMQEQIEKYAI